jgi:AsmA protein
MKKTLKIFGGILLFLLFMLIVTPFFFQDRIQQEVKNLANRTLKSEVNFAKMNVSFFSHFPKLTLTLTDFSLKSAAPFKDTLISAHEISVGVNLKSLFEKTIVITHVYFNKAKVNILYNEQGAANFNVYESADTTASTSKKDTTPSGAALNIEHVFFKDCLVIYADPAVPVRVEAHGLNYSGASIATGDFFDVTSKVDIDALDIVYDQKKYLDAKPVTAKLTTKVNSKDLSVNFEKNDLMIKNIPLQFNGKFFFEKDGYQLNLSFLSVLEKEFLSARFKIRQVTTPWISAKINASLDLGKWSKALDVKTIDIRGLYELNLTAEGSYYSGPDQNSFRKDTVLLSIPKFNLMTKLTGGYLKYHSMPRAISNISLALNASCPDNNYKNINVHLNDLNATFLKNQIKGHLNINSLRDVPIEADLAGSVNLAELKQVIPLDSIDLSGMLSLDVKVDGNYAPEKKIFPHTTATIDFRDGFVKTKYYPHPVEKIGFHAVVTNQTGTMNDVGIALTPLTFLFEGQTFTFNASMNNLDDLEYDIKAKGTIDVGKIYKVFSRQGMALDGLIETDLSLKGRQSDAAAGRIERLNNKGKLSLRNIALSSELFPKPFIIRTGNFRFDQDKIWFDQFKAIYGASDFNLKGAVSNIVNYALSKGGTLKGNFQLNSDFLNVDEFMAFAPADDNAAASTAKAPSVTKTTEATASAAVTETGVVIIPADLDIEFKAAVKTTTFEGLQIKDLTGEIDLKKGILVLKETGFNLVGCNVRMGATYGSITPQKAFFDFQIKADNFDVKRAYNEIALIRELASCAGKAEGVVSLDYALKGRLNGEMYPVMPSLEGGGTISVNKVKFYGFKLFNDISKGTQKEGLNNPDMSKVDIKSTIKNNTITLEQFKFKVKGIRLKISGTTTFDSQLNMKVRVGLGPFGIIGIPMKISGPIENLKIKYGRGKEGENEEIPDSAYSDQLSKEMLDRIKSAKEDDDNSPETPEK